jgi:hypothetical protein
MLDSVIEEMGEVRGTRVGMRWTPRRRMRKRSRSTVKAASTPGRMMASKLKFSVP